MYSSEVQLCYRVGGCTVLKYSSVIVLVDDVSAVFPFMYGIS
jgi:hypothetical protein